VSKRNSAASPVLQQKQETGGVAAPAADSDNDDPSSAFTDPELALDFVERTGVDALAISFGNVHGTYRGEPNLDLDLVREIYALVDVPLVMHGASGLADSEYQKIVESGISKVCYYTAMGKRAANDIRSMLVDGAGRDAVVYHEIMARAIDFFRADTEKVMSLVGCIGVV
jgi:fructose-bisphosphate aldolase class II